MTNPIHKVTTSELHKQAEVLLMAMCSPDWATTPEDIRSALKHYDDWHTASLNRSKARRFLTQHIGNMLPDSAYPILNNGDTDLAVCANNGEIWFVIPERLIEL
jgi:hypothetical protein